MLRRHVPFAALLLVPCVGLAIKPFSFVLPDGFLDITRQSKPPLSPIDDAFYEAARSLDFMAVRLMDGRAAATCGAKIHEGESAPTDLSKAIEAARRQLPSGSSLEVLSLSQVSFNGVSCGRLETARKGPEGPARMLTFILPGAGRWAQLDLVVFDLAHYEEIATTFEASAARTGGLTPRANGASSPSERSSSSQAKLGIVLLLVGAVAKLLHRRRRGSGHRQPRVS
jgi:hypothetical protein